MNTNATMAALKPQILEKEEYLQITNKRFRELSTHCVMEIETKRQLEEIYG